MVPETLAVSALTLMVPAIAPGGNAAILAATAAAFSTKPVVKVPYWLINVSAVTAVVPVETCGRLTGPAPGPVVPTSEPLIVSMGVDIPNTAPGVTTTNPLMLTLFALMINAPPGLTRMFAPLLRQTSRP